MTPKARLSLPRTLIEACGAEAARMFPLETGGALMGQRFGPDLWQVDHIIGPGPGARHERYRFQPDADWHHARIAERFHATGGCSTYIGDWHSHPRARHGRMSIVDRAAARTILRSPDSGCDRVLTGILWGDPNGWRLNAWACELDGGWPWNAGVAVVEVRVEPSDADASFIA